MLYRFKSKACADLIMFEADGRRMTQILLGRESAQGIVRAADLPAAIAQLEQAVAQDEALRQARLAQAEAKARAPVADESDEREPELPPVRLAQRAAPMLQMLRHSLDEQADVVWGV